jgi:hypothetical protein
LATLVWLSGCASSDHGQGSISSYRPTVFAPDTPPFLIGPVGALLTNSTGFSAHVVQERSIIIGQPQFISGELVGRGSKLIFSPDEMGPKEGHGSYRGLIYIWDVAKCAGYVLDEPMQGYAPISSSVQVTNLVIGGELNKWPALGVGKEGNQPLRAVITSSDGVTAQYDVWRGSAMGGFPERIAAVTNTWPLKLTISKLRPERVNDALFLPPEGFTRYESEEGMLTEQTVRQQNLKRRLAPAIGEPLTPEQPSARPTGSGR